MSSSCYGVFQGDDGAPGLSGKPGEVGRPGGKGECQHQAKTKKHPSEHLFMNSLIHESINALFLRSTWRFLCLSWSSRGQRSARRFRLPRLDSSCLVLEKNNQLLAQSPQQVFLILILFIIGEVFRQG